MTNNQSSSIKISFTVLKLIPNGSKISKSIEEPYLVPIISLNLHFSIHTRSHVSIASSEEQHRYIGTIFFRQQIYVFRADGNDLWYIC